MTREFNKQRRYDSRPPYRDTPSNFHGEERPSGPTRPRLNREIVDRAWENGAAHRHPDYQPRQNGKPHGQAPRNAWQKNSYGAPSSPNGSAGNRPYGNRQDQNTYNNQYRQQSYQRQSPRQFNDDRGPRRQSFDRQSGPANYGGYERRERPSNTSWQSNNNNGRYTPGEQPRFRHPDSPQSRGSGSSFRPTQPQPYQRGHNEGQRFQGGQRATGPERGYNSYSDRGPRQGNFRQHGNGYQPRTQSPRPGAPIRPNRWNGHDSQGRQDTTYYQPHTKQFEGDYERFGYENTGYAGKRGVGASSVGANYEHTSQQAPERHVTPLPDGRVLKGPRPLQRRQAQFWNGVSEETSTILKQVQASPSQEEPRVQAPDMVSSPVDQQQAQVSRQGASRPTPVIHADTKKPARRIASAERRKKAAASKTYPPGPRPSQRGFKWPVHSEQNA